MTSIGHVLLLWKSCTASEFGTKHNIMIQLAKVYWVGITDPFLDLWVPLGAPKGSLMSKQVVLRPQIVPKLAF